MFSVKSILSAFILMTIVNYYGANARECYVCRGCLDVTDNERETCPSSPVDNSSEGSGDPEIPDNSVNPGSNEEGNQDTSEDSYISGEPEYIPSRSSSNNDGYRYPPHVIIRNRREASDEEESDARCVVAYFDDPVTGDSDVVRGCTFESGDHEASCRQAIGEDFTGTVETCRVCNTDGCNSAGKAAAAIFLLFISIFVNKML